MSNTVRDRAALSGSATAGFGLAILWLAPGFRLLGLILLVAGVFILTMSVGFKH